MSRPALDEVTVRHRREHDRILYSITPESRSVSRQKYVQYLARKSCSILVRYRAVTWQGKPIGADTDLGKLEDMSHHFHCPGFKTQGNGIEGIYYKDRVPMRL